MDKVQIKKEKSSAYMDVLREIGNIGAGNATTALSQMLDCKIDMDVPKAKFVSFCELSQILGGAEKPVLGVMFKLSQDIEGMMLFVLDIQSARSLAKALLPNRNDDETLSEMDISTIKEVGNIISGAYVYSLSEMCNMTIWTSVPYITQDMAGAVLSVPAIEIAKTADEALIIETIIKDGINDVNGYFILIPEENALNEIVSRLGVEPE